MSRVGVMHRHAFGGEKPGGLAFAHADGAGQPDDKRALLAMSQRLFQTLPQSGVTLGLTPKKASKDGAA